MHWRQNPQRVAWIILIANFTVFCVLAVVAPLALRGYVLHATRALTAYVSTTEGTVQLRVPGASEPNAVPERRVVPEGSQLVTDSVARALLVVSSDAGGQQVLARVQLFPDSSLQLRRIQSPRFSVSRDSDDLLLVLERGRAHLVTSETSRTVRIQLDTPQSSTVIGDGILDVAIRGDDAQVTAVAGSAQVTAAGTQVALSEGQRVSIPTGRAPGLPVPAEQNLVRNGTLEGDLAPAWKTVMDVSPEHQPGRVTRETMGQRKVVRLQRRAEDGVPNMIGLTQTLEQDVQGLDSLVLGLDLQLLYQSVPGGGTLNSEYPVMVDVAYRDVYGKDLHWFQYFYYRDLPPGSTWVPPTGEKLPIGAWYTYESPNLFDVLKDTRPARIHSITISARGHDYESMISDVALVAR
jgi:hypothetical protein